MSVRPIVQRLLDRGMKEGAAPRLDALFGVADAALARDLDRQAHSAWWVPGRLEVFGKHTDYAGGHSLVTTLPRGFAVVGAPRPDGIVRIVDAGDRSTVRFDTSDLERFRPHARRSQGWERYVETVVGRLLQNFPDASIGADIALVSDLPRAAGASSSSALTVGTTLAIAKLSGLDQRADWRANLPTPIALAGYLSCVENGMTYGALEGGTGVGTLSGSEDQTAMLCCRAGTLSEFSYLPVTHIDDAPMPEEWAFIVASSGVVAEKAGAAQALYNRASAGVRRLLELWSGVYDHAASLADALASRPDGPDVLLEIVEQSTSDHWPAEYLERRLTQFVRENARVPEATRAFRASDAHALDALSAASHADAHRLLGNQVEETNALEALARPAGAFAASAFGAGFGGSAWALAPRAEAASVGQRWMAAYHAQFPQHDLATWFEATPSPSFVEIHAD
jgi:galactokinase